MPHDTQANHSELYQDVNRQCRHMVAHLATSGREVPLDVVEILEKAPDLKSIMAVHGQLSKLVSPATPQGITLMRGEPVPKSGSMQRRWSNLWGPIPIVREMMLLALLCLAAVITIDLMYPDVGLQKPKVEELQPGGLSEAKASDKEKAGAAAGRLVGAIVGAAAGRVVGLETGEGDWGEEEGRLLGGLEGEKAGLMAGAAAADDAAARETGAKAGAEVGAKVAEALKKSLPNKKSSDFNPHELLLLALAGLGATFATLFDINKRVVDRVFDPDMRVSYWLKCILGLVSGFLLATLLPVKSIDYSEQLLALLGGFSGSAVHLIMARLVETLETLVKGSGQERITRQEQAPKVRAVEEPPSTKSATEATQSSPATSLQKTAAAGELPTKPASHPAGEADVRPA